MVLFIRSIQSFGGIPESESELLEGCGSPTTGTQASTGSLGMDFAVDMRHKRHAGVANLEPRRSSGTVVSGTAGIGAKWIRRRGDKSTKDGSVMISFVGGGRIGHRRANVTPHGSVLRESALNAAQCSLGRLWICRGGRRWQSDRGCFPQARATVCSAYKEPIPS